MRGRFPFETSSLVEVQYRFRTEGWRALLASAMHKRGGLVEKKNGILDRKILVPLVDFNGFNYFDYYFVTVGKSFGRTHTRARAHTQSPPMTGRGNTNLTKSLQTYSHVHKKRMKSNTFPQRRPLLLVTSAERGRRQRVRTEHNPCKRASQPEDTSGATVDGHVVPGASPLKWSKSFDKLDCQGIC